MADPCPYKFLQPLPAPHPSHSPTHLLTASVNSIQDGEACLQARSWALPGLAMHLRKFLQDANWVRMEASS